MLGFRSGRAVSSLALRYPSKIQCSRRAVCAHIAGTHRDRHERTPFVGAAFATLVAVVGASGPSPSACEESEGTHKFDAARWAETLAQIKDGIVSLKVTSVRAFDSHKASTGQATGFVVDREKGLILTNRHVVTEGPVLAEALFDNHEEVQIRAVYRDPVHDFGVFKYEPSKLQNPSHVAELKLRPDKAIVGLDVRVIGNNAGEKLSVLGAMLARLDREAPFYGRRTYNDFNTFYFQAASATSGGSSGSPVVDYEGDVIALNAAGKMGTSASFYLPLDRVKRAVDLIRAGQPVTRGTLQATFVFTPFSELARLGLPAAEAETARKGGEDVGMLVVRSTVPEGPVSGLLEPGDILLSLNGKRITRFVPLEELLDDAVGETIEICVQRGGQFMRRHARVCDLHDITPHAYFQCGDAVFNNLSYQIARSSNLPVKSMGVYVASPGYMLRNAGIPAGSIILQVGDRHTRNVHELEDAFASLPQDSSVPVQFTDVGNHAHRSVALVRVDRTWFPMQLTTRDTPIVGEWTSRESPRSPAASCAEEHVFAGLLGGKTRFAPGSNDVEEKLSRALVKVDVSVPLLIDGVPNVEYVGTGMLVDTENGFIICDRNTTPGVLCDCTVTFGSSCTVPAHCIYLHPLHNLAVLKYDTRLVKDVPLEAVKMKRWNAHELQGKELWHVSLAGSKRSGFKLTSQKGDVMESEPNVTPLSDPPRWQETNIDLLEFKGGASNASSQDGVICTAEGEVVAYWASFLTQMISGGRRQDGQYFAGITTDTIDDTLQAVRNGSEPVKYALGVEMEKLGLSVVRGMLMDQKKSEEVEARCKHWPPQVMSVRRRWAGTGARQSLKDNDIILEINGQHIETFRDAELAVADKPKAHMLVVRGGKELTLDVDTLPVSQSVTERVVRWCGAVLQAPPPAVAAQRGQELLGVYVSSRFHGSPAVKYGLPTMSRIVEVDGEPVQDLDQFLQRIVGKKDGDNVRIKQLDLRGAPSMTCLRVDTKFWPITELRRLPGPRAADGVEPFHWRRAAVKPGKSQGDIIFEDLTAIEIQQ
eukprot:TRINITY_DN7009_c0_g3_i1.p1 TRINITY_DN7009_c0_g3~~TRINITY_DN7009_c0_g3_i1.p1  ORF type:complete len:1044 (+),score=149.24 TRINITY_DN7009_c0_g3_i1:48-3179(+)